MNVASPALSSVAVVGEKFMTGKLLEVQSLKKAFSRQGKEVVALEKFDLSRAIKFETYAIPRIKGAIIDELRAMDWVPRSVRFKAREIEKAYSSLEADLKRAPTESEVSKHMGISRSELHDVVSQISFVSVMALDEVLSVGDDRGEKISLLDTLADPSIDPTTSLEGQETRGMLAGAIDSSRRPRPTSRAVKRGSPAISPHTLIGMRARLAASMVNWMSRSTAGCNGL